MLRSEQSTSVVTGVVLVASLLTTCYLIRENKLLRRKLDHDGGGDRATTAAPTNQKPKQRQPCHESKDVADRPFVMHEIGVIQSPFPQRAGCPRQGTLAPHVKSLLVLHPHVSPQTLDGILGYSHVWVTFCFHLNPRNKAKNVTFGKATFRATKVQPPRAPKGTRVGVFATRAPHRPNPVGLSLALLEDVTTILHSGTKKKQTCLVLRGLDLVDGTPVYDVKPFVPFDQVECNNTISNSAGDSNDLCVKMKSLRVPPWVSAKDELATVSFTELAHTQLADNLKYLKPLYTDTNEELEEASKALREIVAQDPRAKRDGRGKSSTGNESFEFTFGELRVRFTVDSDKNEANIVGVHVDEGDITASETSYPHNLALRRLAEEEARASDVKLAWRSRVREGVTKGLFDLHGGGEYRPKQVPL